MTSFPGEAGLAGCYTMFDPVVIIFSFKMSQPSQPDLSDHQTDWFQS